MDQPTTVRPGEELPLETLNTYLTAHWTGHRSIESVRQFPGGYSNLTYAVETNLGSYVLRRPPKGAAIKTAHDMGREFQVLQGLHGIYEKIPRAILHCTDDTVIGAPFFIMERVSGIILRNRPPKDDSLRPEMIRQITSSAIENMAVLHQLDLNATPLALFGKPEGYVQRQVAGWIDRYYRAETETIPSMNQLAEWMPGRIPVSGTAGLIHNDYKYDNLVLDPEHLPSIKAVLDWEMCTVGDPLMDLGTTLGYWVEPSEASPLITGIANLTWLPGNLTRQEVVDLYASRTGRNLDNILFYYAFGTFKIGVIAQQIYARYLKGFTKDPRFAQLIHVVKLFGQMGENALERDRISAG